MTQEEIDKMIEDWVENGFPSELKQLILDGKECITINIKDMKGGIFNPVAEIGQLDYNEAKKVMLKAYNHDLSEEEYPLLLASGSLLEFFEAVSFKHSEVNKMTKNGWNKFRLRRSYDSTRTKTQTIID